MSAYNDTILAFLPSADCVAIKLYYNKPAIMTADEENVWIRQSRREAFYLKSQLELDTIKISTVIDRLILNALPNPFAKEVSEQIIRELTAMQRPSDLDKIFIKITKRIRKTVTLTKADTERCLQLLGQHKRLPINKLLLIAHPKCVGTIRNLRTYIGNLAAWTLTDAEEAAFKTQAGKIRSEANLIYASFKTHFQPMPQCKFWQYYVRMAMVYKAYIIQQRH